MLIDKESGEVINENYEIEELDDLVKKNNIIQKRKSEDKFYKYIDKEIGSFYFNYYKRFKPTIPTQYIFRFIYLCCFMDYDNNLIWGESKQYMSEKDMQEVLKLAKTEFYTTKKTLLKNDLIQIVDDSVKINKLYSIKGGINKNKKVEIVRMFENTIKDLYEKSLPREHKNVGILIKLLPFVNFRYNILCSNPREENLENIIALANKDLIEILDISKPTQLKLLKIKVNKEPAFIKVDNCYLKNVYVINPKIYYKGNDIDDLAGVINLFKVKKSTRKRKK